MNPDWHSSSLHLPTFPLILVKLRDLGDSGHKGARGGCCGHFLDGPRYYTVVFSNTGLISFGSLYLDREVRAPSPASEHVQYV